MEVLHRDSSSLSRRRSSPFFFAMTISDSTDLILFMRRLSSSLSVLRFLSIIRSGVSLGVEICELTREVCAVNVMAERAGLCCGFCYYDRAAFSASKVALVYAFYYLRSSIKLKLEFWSISMLLTCVWRAAIAWLLPIPCELLLVALLLVLALPFRALPL